MAISATDVRLGRLVQAIQELAGAKELTEVTTIVRQAARYLADADGVTFVLRESSECAYVDEDAIQPLWKGRRFPLQACISGWVMLNKQQVAISDIYQDHRVPHDAYRPTFVKSLLMTPIRSKDPIGAIGVYWAAHHSPKLEEAEALQILADATATAISNVQLYRELSQQVESYKRLAEELRRSKEQLSAEVAELEKFRQVTVGRELRMIELEKEMARLRASLQSRR
jgi:GAF domain-containing protein